MNMFWESNSKLIAKCNCIPIYPQAANSQTTELPIEKHLIPFQMKFKSYKQTPKSLSHKEMKPMQLIEEDLDQARLEILKAAVQAWHGHTNRSSTNSREADPCIHKFKAKPSRFKMERLRYLLDKSTKGRDAAACWDFEQSLWDSYEVVTVSKQLENGMVLEQAFAKPYSRKQSAGRNGEAVNSLRFLFNHASSRRFVI